MRKININLIVVILSFAFFITGVVSPDMFYGFKSNIYQLIYSTESNSVQDRVSKLIAGVENTANKVSYHDLCVDFSSWCYEKTNRRIIKKDEDVIVKMDNGYLAYSYDDAFNEKDAEKKEKIEVCAKNVVEFNNYLKSKSIGFVYAYAPIKGYDGGFPASSKNNIKNDANLFLNILNNNQVPYIDFYAEMKIDNITEEDAFFITDHHWKPNIGFWANSKICNYLSDNYDFDYDTHVTDINNYNVTTYDNIFLGSQGKKTGRFFTDLGIDSIDLIEPKFNTDFIVEGYQIPKSTGSFSDTLIYKDRLEKDYYNKNPYTVYCGSDYAWQKIVNQNCTNGKKILLIQDSFANCVKPYLALNASEIYSVDLREKMFGEDRIESLTEIVEDFRPDYVVVLYSRVAYNDVGKYDFN